jgi:hypothetical protein
MTADPENARLRTLLRRLHSMLAARDPVVFSQELGFIEAELQGQNGAVGFTAETSAPLLGMDTPWPLHETVAKLIQATEHLLGHHQCDVHGHEEFRTAANRAKEYLAALRSPETPVHSTRAGAPLLAAEINALPQRVRDYIHHLETDADPAGDKWRLAAAEENLAALTTLDSETPAHRKWPGEPPHCPSCSCGAPAAALRRYIVEQLGFLSDDDNCPAERFIRLAVAKLRAPETKCDEYGCTGCRSSPCICAQLAPCEHDFDAAGTCKKCRWPFDGNTVKASEPQCICATTAEPLRLVDPQCPKHSTRG